MISRPDIESVAVRIEPFVRETPVAVLEKGAFGLDVRVALKL